MEKIYHLLSSRFPPGLASKKQILIPTCDLLTDFVFSFLLGKGWLTFKRIDFRSRSVKLNVFRNCPIQEKDFKNNLRESVYPFCLMYTLQEKVIDLFIYIRPDHQK